MPTTRLDVGALPEELTFQVIEERTLSLDEIEPLQYEPKSVEHELNDSLYESITQIGLQSPLVVAQAPNEKCFVPIAGGNSRLQVLSRLYDETGEESFANVQCVVSEWPGLARAQLAHVITNQIRIRYSFASKAMAVVHIVDCERNSKPLNQRDAVQFLTSNGYPISQSTFSYMEYLVSRLCPIVSPELLEAMEIRDIRTLREIENRAAALVGEYSGTNEDFNKLFNRALGEAALASANSDELIEELKFRLGPRTSTSESSEDLLPNSNDSHEELCEGLPPVSDVQLGVAESGLVKSDRHSVVVPEVNPNIGSESGLILDESTGTQQPEDKQKVISEPAIRQLRQTAGHLAEEICRRFDMNECILRESEHYGFRVVAQPNGEESTIQYRLWCYLQAFAGDDQQGACSVKVEDELGQKNTPVEATHSRSLKTSKRFLDANVWFELDDRSWRNFVDLWDTVRTLKKNGHSYERGRVERRQLQQVRGEEVADVNINY